MTLPLGITVDAKHSLFYLVTESSTYVIGTTKEGLLLNLYWGPRLSTSDGTTLLHLTWEAIQNGQDERSSQDPWLTSAPEEYPVFGGLRFGDLCLKATMTATGTRELDLALTAHNVHDEGTNHLLGPTPVLTLTLQDKVYTGLKVLLVYKVDTHDNIIDRSTQIVNGSNSTIHIEQGLSAAWHLPPSLNQRQLVRLCGAWCAETLVQKEEPLRPGAHVSLSSTRGIPSAQAYPYMAIVDKQDNHTYFGTLAWSGNWLMQLSVDTQGNTRWTGGVCPFDFMYPLHPGDAWETPSFLAGFTDKGLAGARRHLPSHVLRHSHRLSRPGDLPVLYNSWEATGFHVNVDQQFALATQAAGLGIELFVLDDGWFKGRNNDRAGLGDWFHDKHKFPDGLTPLANFVHGLGMRFGLWFEPEMVNQDSDLYREHPDWVYHYSDRPRSEARHQLVLDLTRQDVYDYVYERLYCNIKTIGIDYIKWDMNRPISEAGTCAMTTDRAKLIWVQHVQAFYRLLDRLRDDFPDLQIESCSSGGGRADAGVTRRVDQIWVSDNTRPDARLEIQHGVSLILPPRQMVCWITDMGQDDLKVPLAYRCHVSFMGTLGVGADLNKYSEKQKSELRSWINVYKRIRHIIQPGHLDWLHFDKDQAVAFTLTRVPGTNGYPEEAVVLGFRWHNPFWLTLPRLRLKHLDPEAIFDVILWSTDPEETTRFGKHTGSMLVNVGLDLSPFLDTGSWKSVVIYLRGCHTL
ncbi:alpha-galactosidase [Hesseltinella vesiculosa]|uniref:Alpha-galactosidase n=1 Tax=Hesseltinella vesiculosa TaxID=101127 RepID=A0A1X2G640_9FUNG|nr:alpha-galactosidase [Hesseltinella vesiculosa]